MTILMMAGVGSGVGVSPRVHFLASNLVLPSNWRSSTTSPAARFPVATKDGLGGWLLGWIF